MLSVDGYLVFCDVRDELKGVNFSSNTLDSCSMKAKKNEMHINLLMYPSIERSFLSWIQHMNHLEITIDYLTDSQKCVE